MTLFKQDVGSLSHTWTSGYNGQKAFLADTCLLYVCDTVIKCTDTQTEETHTFSPFKPSPENNGIGLLAVSATNNKFAFSDVQVPPTVYIHNVNDFAAISRLNDGASFEYTRIEFSNGDVILTMSGIPDLIIGLWNWKSGEKLLDIDLKPNLTLPNYVCLSPTNWRNVTVAYEDEFHVWKVEQCDDLFKATKTRFLLPRYVENNFNELFPKNMTKQQNVTEPLEEFYPDSIIAAIPMDYDDKLTQYQDKRESQRFQCLCWNNSDEVYVATHYNCIYKYNVNTHNAVCLFRPLSNELSENEGDGSGDGLEYAHLIKSTNIITSIFLHKKGLFLVCDDGMVRLLDITQLDLAIDKRQQQQIKLIFDMRTPAIANISFNSTYSLLSLATDRAIYLYNFQTDFEHQAGVADGAKIILAQDPNREDDKGGANRLSTFIDYNYGPSVAIENLNPLNEAFITLKKNGVVQIWSIGTMKIINKLFLNTECTSLATHPHMALCVVGTESGHLIFIDCANFRSQLRILYKTKIHSNIVQKVKFNQSGTLLFSAGDDGRLYVTDMRLTDKVEYCLVNHSQMISNDYKKNASLDTTHFKKAFYVLGFTEFDGDIVSLDTYDQVTNLQNDSITTRVGLSLYDANNTEFLKKSLIDATNLDAQSAAMLNAEYSNLVTSSENQVKFASKLMVFDFNFEFFSDKKVLYNSLRKLDFRDEATNKFTFLSHYFFNDFCFLNRSSILAYVDRNICKMTIPDIEINRKVSKISYLELQELNATTELPHGRITRLLNNEFIIVASMDGSFLIFHANNLKLYTETKGHHYNNGGYSSVAFTYDYNYFLSIGGDNSVLVVNWNCDNPNISLLVQKPTIEGEYDGSEVQKLDNTEDALTEKKDELTWLEARELDYVKSEDESFLSTKKTIKNNLDELKKGLKELMSANKQRDKNAKLEEHEFYLDLDELTRLQKEADAEIQKIREKSEFDNMSKIYLKEVIRKECWEKMRVKGRGIEAFNGTLFVENYPLKERSRAEVRALERVQLLRRIELGEFKAYKDMSPDFNKKENQLAEIDEDDTQKDEVLNTTANPNNSQQSSNGQKLSTVALKGSFGSLYDGDSPYFYNQFELHSPEQKWMQIILLQDAIYRIKENFNKEFEQIMQRKLLEISKIKEKNQRLKQIYVDLNEERPLRDPVLSDIENPELLFEVKDDEIKVEKYLTSEQKKVLEEQVAEENRRSENDKLDNWRERGLLEMMGGVLQIRREDELKKDVPPPPFLKENKLQDEWTLEELKQFQAYELKVKELNDEREKLRKQLNTEVNKLIEQINECYQNFDTVLLQLHLRKIRTQQAVYQEELKIIRLLNTLIVNAELERHEETLVKRLDEAKEYKKNVSQDLLLIKRAIDIYKEEYDKLVFEDKAHEKAFNREFSDVPQPAREQLFKLYKKRPKTRLQVNKTVANPQNILIAELGANNPYADRPSTAQQHVIYENDLEKSLREIDNLLNAPVGVEVSVWNRFVHIRRDKIQTENNLKWKNTILNEMNAYMQKRLEEEEQKRKEIDDFFKQIQHIQDLRTKTSHNLEIQFLVKQGHVEIDPGSYVHNFDTCLLINRNVVNQLNQVIQAHGKQKITIMVECKDFKKGIRQLEWEHRQRRMQIEDALQKQKDITYLKLTREVQEYLGVAQEEYDAKKQKEISKLEQTLAFQSDQYGKKYNLQGDRLGAARREAVKVGNYNDQFDEKLQETNVVLHERMHVYGDISSKDVQHSRDERFREILQRRKLVDLAKTQAQEVAFLRSEVERLRMKTFPALVQIEF